MQGLFCDDINMRAAEYASRRYPDRSDHWLWQLVADAYAEGACSQYNIDNREQFDAPAPIPPTPPPHSDWPAPQG